MILVALDASSRAPEVLAVAAKFATAMATKLILYRAVSIPPDVPLAVLIASERSLEDILISNGREDLQRLAATLPADLVEDIVVTFATAAEGIRHMANERDAELVVIGAHGYGKLDRLLGTTAAKVVNRCPRSVLVVRDHER